MSKLEIGYTALTICTPLKFHKHLIIKNLPLVRSNDALSLLFFFLQREKIATLSPFARPSSESQSFYGS